MNTVKLYLCIALGLFALEVDVGRFGDAANYQLQGPNLVNLDLALLKDFHLTEHKTLQFEALFNDALNHPHLGLPSAKYQLPDYRGSDHEYDREQIMFAVRRTRGRLT